MSPAQQDQSPGTPDKIAEIAQKFFKFLHSPILVFVAEIVEKGLGFEIGLDIILGKEKKIVRKIVENYRTENNMTSGYAV